MTLDFMPEEDGQHRRPSLGTALHLSASPHADLEQPLELLGVVVPPVAVAEGMGRQVILRRMDPTAAVGQDVIGLPLRAHSAAANMTPATALAKHERAVLRAEVWPTATRRA